MPKSPHERFLILITSRCKVHCPECLYKEKIGNVDLPLEIVEREIAPLITPSHEVNIAGGEPTEHPQFFEIVKAIARRRPKEIQIITNGTTFSGSVDEAKKFFSKLEKIANAARIPVIVRKSVDDMHANGLKGGKKELRQRVINTRKAFSKITGNVFLMFYTLPEKGQSQEELIETYALSKRRTHFAFGRLERGFKQGGNVPVTFITPDGHVHTNERSFVRNRKPLGNLFHTPLKEIMRRWRG